jgi:hypothetical protein
MFGCEAGLHNNIRPAAGKPRIAACLGQYHRLRPNAVTVTLPPLMLMYWGSRLTALPTVT